MSPVVSSSPYETLMLDNKKLDLESRSCVLCLLLFIIFTSMNIRTKKV